MNEEPVKTSSPSNLVAFLIIVSLFIALSALASLFGFFLVILALAPGLFLMFYFYTRDKYELEPRSLILKTFGLGILIAIPAATIEFFLVSDGENVFRLILDYFIGVALVEEFLKFSAFYLGAYRKSEFDEPMDGIVYSVAVALGFATIENVAYVAMGGIIVALLRAVLSVPGHALFGATMGYYSGLAKFNTSEEGKLLARGVLLATVYHGLYDLCITIEPVLLFLVVIPLMIWLAARVRKSIIIALELSPHKPLKEPRVQKLLKKLEESYKRGMISRETYEELKKKLKARLNSQ
ncbi:MAG: hypothetical protein DRN90_03000 [Thermoproteota archaeon]|nr:MAG: hypothetical protein DRN90_03000 [Candidatus Korarchaeota archaeon]